MRRTVKLLSFVRPAEAKQIAARARAMGCSVSDLLRDAVLLQFDPASVMSRIAAAQTTMDALAESPEGSDIPL